MLIKQIIEFELRGPDGPLGVHVLIQFVIFMTKQKENLEVNYYLSLKYCKKQCTLLSPTWAKSLTKFNSKCKILKFLV